MTSGQCQVSSVKYQVSKWPFLMNNPRSEIPNHNSAIDNALRTYPLAPVPATLAPGVMARIRAVAPAPRFRLAWVDYALSLFATGMAGLGLLFWQSITPQMAARMQLQWLLFLQRSGWQTWVGVFAGGLALGVGALLLAAQVFAQTSALRAYARVR